jgi:16S rRNA (guanine527-N7)-methyltransferase
MAKDASAAHRLNELLVSAGLPELDAGLAGLFEAYLELLIRWNTRLNLTAIRESEGILSRHFVESIACARAIPEAVATLLDFGSGAGFPGIPIALCRPEIAVTLAESQTKKAAFLQEALRTLALRANVRAKRAETLASSFDCVTMRAVDRMERAVAAATGLVSAGGWLVLMVTSFDLPALRVAAGETFDWSAVLKLPSSEDRLIAIARRRPG